MSDMAVYRIVRPDGSFYAIVAWSHEEALASVPPGCTLCRLLPARRDEVARIVQIWAECVGKLVAGTLPDRLRFMVVVQDDDGPWATHGNHPGWMQVIQEWAERSDFSPRNETN